MQDMKNEQAQLQEKLYKKMQQEQNEYLEGIKKLPSEEILTKAYAISCRENFLYIVQEDDPLSLEQLQVLLELPHPLAKLYDDWLNLDVSELDLLRGSIQSTLQGILERKAEEKYRNQIHPCIKRIIGRRVLVASELNGKRIVLKTDSVWILLKGMRNGHTRKKIFRHF